MINRATCVVLVLLAAGWPAGCRRPAEPVRIAPLQYQRQIRAWRKKRVARLKAVGGWLRLAGLFWLKPGQNRLGSDPACEIVLPARAPRRIGLLELAGDRVELKIEPGVEATAHAKPVSQMTLASDGDGKREPDRVRVGDFTFFVIERGGRLALRLFDKQAEALVKFHGLDYFPIDQRYRVVASFVPFPEPRMLSVSTAIQTTEQASSPGELVFELDGRKFKLLPMAEHGDQQLFVVFADKTSGHQTYGGGRFLVVDKPAAGSDEVVLDFNKAYNPPCAFTHYATCPIPRKENRLPIKIDAGEKIYRH